MIQIDKEIIETDVLIVGGGIAGLMAAINAADQGVGLLAEKADIEAAVRSHRKRSFRLLHP